MHICWTLNLLLVLVLMVTKSKRLIWNWLCLQYKTKQANLELVKKAANDFKESWVRTLYSVTLIYNVQQMWATQSNSWSWHRTVKVAYANATYIWINIYCGSFNSVPLMSMAVWTWGLYQWYNNVVQFGKLEQFIVMATNSQQSHPCKQATILQ